MLTFLVAVALAAESAPDPCPDGTSDHFHPDVRGACLTEGAVSRGPRDGNFTDIELMEPDTRYTVVMDVDGNDDFGPLTLRVKTFAAGEPEPAFYTTSWQVDGGLSAGDAEDDGLAVQVGIDVRVGVPVEILIPHLDGEPACLYGKVVHRRRVSSGTIELGIQFDAGFEAQRSGELES